MKLVRTGIIAFLVVAALSYYGRYQDIEYAAQSGSLLGVDIEKLYTQALIGAAGFGAIIVIPSMLLVFLITPKRVEPDELGSNDD